MPYKLVTPWNNETWVDNYYTPYARLAGRRITGGTYDGTIPVSLTDIPRGVSLLINGTTVTENRTPAIGFFFIISYLRRRLRLLRMT